MGVAARLRALALVGAISVTLTPSSDAAAEAAAGPALLGVWTQGEVPVGWGEVGRPLEVELL